MKDTALKQLLSGRKTVSNKLMSSHFANEKYFLLNRKLSETYFNDLYKVRAYQNTALALFDVASSLQHLIAHKAHYAASKNGCSIIDAVNTLWIRSVNPLQIKNEAQHWVEFIESLHAETNFVIWASENEITGEILVEPALVQEIHQRLSHKRIFSIQICHHIDPIEKVFPYSVKIVRPSVFQDSSALVVYGDRFKATTQIGNHQNLNFEEKEFADFFKPVLGSVSPEILQIESQINHAKNCYFNRFVPTTSRLNDRVVLNFSQVNAFAIQNELNLADAECFAPSKYPFWILNMWRNWWKEAENEIFLRGLLVLSLHAVRNDASMIEKIDHVVDNYQRLGHIDNI